MNKAYETYVNVNVDTASQGKLILIAYDVAIKHCKMALESFGNKTRIEERTRHLFKGQDAITELMGALKLDVGEIARNLYRLYDYMLRSLIESNMQDNRGKAEEILGYLEMLRGAWDEAIGKVKKDGAEARTAAVGQQGIAVSG